MIFRDVQTVEEIISILKTKKLVVYGTGFVAKRFYEVMQENGLEDNISYYIVTNPTVLEFQGKKVIGIMDYKSTDEEIIIVAVHEAVLEEIICELKDRGVNTYIWIQPYLLDIEINTTSKGKSIIETATLMEKWKEYYIFAIRFLVIEEYYGKNNYGYETYLKANCLFSNEETSKKRLESFLELIKSWEKKGYDQSHLLCVDANNLLIDGGHRFSLILYHGIKEVECVKYYSNFKIRKFFDKVYVDKNILNGLGLKKEVLEELERIQSKLIEMCK